ncbi:Small G protein signaling modulator 1 [Toxocara canis]|nr:Small G protein signaling modulator 1 [Toxocara canis]
MVEVVSSAPILRQLSAREDKRIESNATALFRQISESAIERKTKNGSIITVDFTTEVASEAAKRRERLLNALKKEVKVIMEESVNRRKIHVNSNYVTSLCASVEQCILDGLKRRLLGLFGSRSTYAFLRTISKHCAAAAAVLAKTIIVDKDEEGAFSQNFLWIRIALVEKKLPAILDFIHSSPQCRRYYEKSALMLDPVKGGVVAALLG